MHRRFIFIVLVWLLFPLHSLAGAWLMKPGVSTLINNFYIYVFNGFVDSEGFVSAQPALVKFEYKPYYEYSISDSWAVGFSPSFQHIASEYYVGSKELDYNDAMASADIFIKRLLFKSDEYHYAISLTPMVEVPGVYKEETTPFFGKQESFWGIYTDFGINTYSIEDNYGYVNIQTGIRSRFSESFSDESGSSSKSDILVSLPITVAHSINAGFNYTKSLSGYSGGTYSFLNGYGYDAAQGSISDVYRYRGFDLEFGYISQFYARNGGVGDAIKFSIWHNF